MLQDFWKFNDSDQLTATDKVDEIDMSNKAKFTETFYNQVNDVIGGDNPNQFLTLLFPGIALSKTDFEYDYEKNAAKGPVVEANESRLANKLYDPFHISGADNGRTLPYQYKSALDALTPIINPNIAEAKNKLRDLILSQYPYKLTEEGDDNEINTFQEVFFSLYDDYVKEMVEWSKEQTAHQNEAYAEAEAEFKKKKLIKENIYEKDDKGEPHDEKLIKEFNRTVNDKYLTWYETYGISALNVVNQKMSKLLSVFSVNDMKIIEGILDSGVGAELQEARQTLTNTRKLTPEGGYVYPVKFNPTNWFEYLDTSFPYTDLVESPGMIADELGVLYRRRDTLARKIKNLSDAIPSAADVDSEKQELDNKYNDYQEKFGKVGNAETAGLESLTNGIIGLACGLSSTDKEQKEGEKIAKKSDLKPADKTKQISDIIFGLFTSGKAVTEAVSALDTSMRAYVSAVNKSKKLTNQAALSKSLEMLQGDYENVKSEIETLEGKLKLSAMAGTDAVTTETMPNITPPGYSSFQIAYECHKSKEETEEKITSSTTTKTSGCWIFKTKKTDTTTNSDKESFYTSEDTKIEIGMNIAKVGIEREWFNPGVFTISGDMYRLSSAKVSQTFAGGKDEKPYDPNDYIFPCFPVAMLLARDITVKLSTTQTATGLSLHEFEKKVGDSKGLLFFNKGNGSATSSSSDHTAEKSDAYVVTVRIPTPQVIGFYLENTPADKSTQYEKDTGMFYINDFVKEYQKVIETKVEALKKID